MKTELFLYDGVFAGDYSSFVVHEVDGEVKEIYPFIENEKDFKEDMKKEYLIENILDRTYAVLDFLIPCNENDEYELGALYGSKVYTEEGE